MRRAGLLAAGVLLSLSACGGGSSHAGCAPTSRPADCADLTFGGRSYDELRPIQAPPPEQMQELGDDANYPACTEDPCTGADLGGLGATDVWRLDGVDPEDALIGIRQNSQTYVVYVRVGVDPASLPIPDRESGFPDPTATGSS